MVAVSTWHLLRAATRFVPMAPAPPVTRTDLPARACDSPGTSLCNFIHLTHPIDGASNAFLRRNLRIMLEVACGFRAFDMLDSRGEGLGIFVGHQRVLAARGFQYEV